MNDYKSINNNNLSQPGILSEHITNDGSLTLYSSHYKESFHSFYGAKAEAVEKFLNPANIQKFSTKSPLYVLDVCVGLGYNTACLIEDLQSRKIKMKWWGLELDERPLKIALKKKHFTSLWTPTCLNILKKIKELNHWENIQSQGMLLIGDARKKLSLLPKEQKLDLIFLDPFSPSQCPELWSEEFLSALAQKLSPQGRLITYCSAAAIRGSLRRAGLSIQTLRPKSDEKQIWSRGTIAFLSNLDSTSLSNDSNYLPLSAMEEEHLLTKAAIPYRDPYGERTSQEIIMERVKEQSKSQKESRSSWANRWSKA